MSEAETGTVKLAEMEEYIRQVQGVVSAKVVCANAEIQEIHILADGSRNPKQLVRDVETIILVKSGLNIDHRKISIVQFPDSFPGECRIKLNSTAFKRSGQQVTVTVELGLDDQVYAGQASGPNTGSNQLRLVARATLEAVEQYLGFRNFFVLEDIIKISLSGRQAVAVCVVMVFEMDEEALYGIAAVESSLLEAASKAVLAALNRRLSKFNRK